MKPSGQNLTGNHGSAMNPATYTAFDPATGQPLAPPFHEAAGEEIDRALELATQAAASLRRTSREQRAAFLESITEEITAIAPALSRRCAEETALPETRIEMELGRTLNQVRMFASLIREGSWVDARIDRGDPDHRPAPKPDIRQMLRPIGPVAVFGASNFPLAFSVAGGDTASALAAGNPVVVKAHPSHPGTSELTARAVLQAANHNRMPEGTFSLLHGSRPETSIRLVRHPLLQAVGFTGSQTAGRALMDAAAARPRPIPVFAEMGSTNPVFLLPSALRENAQAIAGGLVQSVTLGNGQFCTKPGLVFILKNKDSEKWLELVRKSIREKPSGCMLNAGILGHYQSGISTREKDRGIQVLAEGGAAGTGQARAVVLHTSFDAFQENPQWSGEVFGPCMLIVTCGSVDEMIQAAGQLDGQLTATLHAQAGDEDDSLQLIRVLETKAGRLIVNGYPTGVEVCASMQHGGPYPASSDARFTSVGTAAIRRFAQPVCYQNFSERALPAELRNRNETGIWRLVDNRFSRDNL